MTKRLLSTTLAFLAMAALTLAGGRAASADEPEYHTQIIGGDPATEVYRFHASMLYRDQGDRPTPLRCSGALIAPQWLVTAAHCIDGRLPTDFRVNVGSNDYLGGTFIDPVKFLVHPDYDGVGNDIGLIMLATPSAEQPITSTVPTPQAPVRMIGWGRTVDGDPASIPRNVLQLDTKLLPTANCDFGDEWSIRPGELCVERGKDGTAGACNGDSGSPLLLKVNGEWRIIGVDSRSGGDFGCLYTDEVYTSTYAHRAWIMKMIQAG